MTITPTKTQVRFSQGVYTLTDAARVLRLPAPKIRRWVTGLSRGDENERQLAVGRIMSKGDGVDKTLSFLALIEIFTIAGLRDRGVSAKTIRQGREELALRFKTPHPFAHEGLLTDGKKLVKELGGQAVLELGTLGQTAFQEILAPFFERLDFDLISQTAVKYYPDGRESSVVVDPRKSFGRPVIENTNVTTEAVWRLIQGGELISDLAGDYAISEKQVSDAYQYESLRLKVA